MNISNRNIDFTPVGAEKEGTSWLYNGLLPLPDFSLSPIKEEVHYFPVFGTALPALIIAIEIYRIML